LWSLWHAVAVKTTSSTRRIGTVDSKTRARIIDAAERLLLDEGYASVTSRRVGAQAGLKSQLVHYYFRTMDDLFVEIYRRRAERDLRRFERALSADPSLRTVWKLTTDPRGTVFSIEFVALANHRKAIRAEIARYAERFRAAQLKALTTALENTGITAEQIPPIAALLLMTGLAQVLTLEDQLGVKTGHEETVTYVQSAIARLEPGQPGGKSAAGPD
jgi:AcrR family transcriptional regulator